LRMSTVKFNWISDEDCDIYVDETFIYQMSHGPHGWDGMEGIRDAVLSMASYLGMSVEISGDEAI
jgi:hypothetical protein